MFNVVAPMDFIFILEGADSLPRGAHSTSTLEGTIPFLEVLIPIFPLEGTDSLHRGADFTICLQGVDSLLKVPSTSIADALFKVLLPSRS